MSKLRYGHDLVALRPAQARRRSAPSPAGPPPRRPQNANRMWFAGFLMALGTAAAISRSCAVPEPSSLMPGPVDDGVQVRADDDGVVGAPARGVGDHVVGRARLADSVDVVMCTVTVPACARLASSLPTAKLVPSTGIATGPPSVPARASVRPALALVEDDHGGCARGLGVVDLLAEVHVPRWTSAMLPAVKPAKSAASQPLVERRLGRRRQRHVDRPATVAVTSPLPEYSMWRSRSARVYVRWRRRRALERRRRRAPGSTGSRTAGRSRCSRRSAAAPTT